MVVTILIIVVLGFAAMVAAAMNQAKENAEKSKGVEKTIREKYDIDELYVSPHDQSFIGFSFDRNMLVLGDPKFDKEFMFSEVATVDIIKNGASITSTNRGSQLLGAAVGGIALGGIGLLAGALTGSKRSVDRVCELGIKVVVDDRVKPLYYIEMFKWPDKKGLEMDNAIVKMTVEKADHLNAHLVNGMRRAAQTREDELRTGPAPNATIPLLANTTYAEQVKQLWELHQAGALSAEEFQQQKILLAPLAS